jgi:hypothetical protein
MPGKNGVKHSEIQQPKRTQYLTYLLLSLYAHYNVRIPYFHMYEREKVQCKRTMYCTVHFIITL